MTLPDYIAREIVNTVFRGDWIEGGPTDKTFSQMHEDWLEETYGEKDEAKEIK